MLIVNSIAQLQEQLNIHRSNGLKIGFIPTMGNLHLGHLSLVDKAKETADIVVVSLFVNPTQFGPNEDFDSYPKTLEDDCRQLEQHATDIVFVPSTKEVYPKWPNITSVKVEQLDQHHCGASRPVFFAGITTVVTKLFNMVRPDLAVFGEKDFQQLTIIKRMVLDLNFDIEIIGAPIIREDNGLAMSSRNGYLSKQQKEHASKIHQTLLWAKKIIEQGEKDFRNLETQANKKLAQLGFTTDYFNIARREDLHFAEAQDTKLVILLGLWMGKVRLIDNIQIDLVE